MTLTRIAAALATLVTAWVVILSATGARAESSPKVLMGSAPAQNAPPLNAASLSGAGRLHVVIDSPYEVFTGAGSYVHTVVYGANFRPLSGARVYVGKTPVGITDSRGTLVFRYVPRGGQHDDGYVSLTAVWSSRGKRLAGQVPLEAYLRTTEFESAQLYVYTDRGVYSPGDTVHVRAIAWRLRGEYEPIADKRVELQLQLRRADSAGGKLRGGGSFVTSRFGTGGFDLSLPNATAPGTYDLVAIFGGAREKTRLRVERVVPPTVEIRHNLPRALSMDQKRLPLRVRLASFSGAAPTRGELKVQLEHEGRALFSTKQFVTGAPHYDIEINTEKLSRVATDGERFTVVMTVTNPTGQHDRVRREMTLAEQPYRAVIETDKEHYAPGEKAKLQVKLVDLEGTATIGKPVRVKLSGQIPAPAAQKTNSFGVALFNVLVADEPVDVGVFVDDVVQPIGAHTLEVTSAKPMLSKIVTPLVKERQRVPMEVTIAPGFEPTERVVHADIVDSSGSLVSAFLLPLKKRGNKWIATGSFTAPTWGTMLLTLFCAAQSGTGTADAVSVGLLTEGQQITVAPNAALRVTLDGVPSTASPGQSIRVSGRVLDSRGRAATASVGASVVDAAVLSLLDPLELKPHTRFYSPQLKVLATTGEKMLTWPVVTRNWGIDREDIALPPFGFREGNDPDLDGRDEDDAFDQYAGGGAIGSLMGGSVSRGGARKGSGKAARIGGPPSRAAPAEEFAVSSPQPAASLRRTKPKRIGEPAVKITLRTKMPATALWLENIVAERGKFSFDVTMPDAITRQTITAVASDSAGGVGVAQRDISVRQKIFARSSLPATMRLGDRVRVVASVQNLTDKPVRASLALTSDGLTVEDGAPRVLEVPPQSAMSAGFNVTPRAVGDVTYELITTAPGVEDHERKHVRVRPAGIGVRTTLTGRATPDTPFRAELDRDDNAAATLEVVLGGAGQVVNEYLATVGQGSAWGASFSETPGAGAALAVQLAMLLNEHGQLTDKRGLELRDAIGRDVVLISSVHDGQGGFDFFRSGRFSPYLTGRALEGLAAAQKAQFPVPPAIMEAAGGRILRSLDKTGLVNVDDHAWWNGPSTERRLALTAHLFRILAEAGPDAVPMDHAGAFEWMRERAQRVPNLTNDPLSIANAGMGLLAYEENFMGGQISARVARRYVRRIMEAYQNGYWEPLWFNSAGGRLQATAAAFELIQIFDPPRAATMLPKTSRVLLETRSSVGAWHNAASTLALARTLVALPTEPAELQAFSIRILVDGAQVANVAIDPQDPFGSAMPLAGFDLTPHLKAGPHVLEVHTGGQGSPFVAVRVRRDQSEVESPGVSATRKINKTKLRPGELATVTLGIRSDKRRGMVAIEEPLPANTIVEARSLDKLVSAGKIQEYSIRDGTLLLYVTELRGKIDLTYKLRAVRTGSASMGPTTIRGMHEAGAANSGASSRLVVE